MPVSGEHKTVQARILRYAQEIGWTYVPRDEAERRRGFDADGATAEDRARNRSLFFGDLLHAQVCDFNPKYKEAEGALVGEFQRFHSAKGLDGLTYFVLCKLTDDDIPNPEQVSRRISAEFAKFPNWQRSEAELRELRKQVTFAVFSEEDDLEKVTATVEALFTLLQKSFRP